MEHAGARGARRRNAALWLVVACVLGAYAVVATQWITLPGVYMDAVNPDYLVAKVLNRAHAEPQIAWVLPGNYLANRFPILVSLYHGLQQFWLGLPLYALFGMSVAGIRLTHMVFAMTVLAALLVLLQRARVPVEIAAPCALALALDPAFIFAFRTQSYITMAPAAWLLLSVALLVGADALASRVRRGFASGVCFGFAVLGYFVYAFYLPAMLPLVATWAWRRDDDGADRVRIQAVLAWLGGLGAGCAYYVLGYALLARKLAGGAAGLVAFIGDSSVRLDAFPSALSLGQRVAAAASFVDAVITNGWHHLLMFAAPPPSTFDAFRIALLIVLPLLLLAYAEGRRQSTPLLRMAVALPVSFFVVSLAFGNRLGGHHYMSFLPLAYIALAAGLAALRTGMRPERAGAVVAAAMLGFGSLAAVNIVATQREFGTLVRTGGVGLYSDAVNRLATDVATLSSKSIVYFPDWGLSLPVILISGGAVATSAVVDADDARRRLCAGRDVAIAVVGSDASRFESWASAFGWHAARVTAYAQRDGAIVAQLGVFAASAGARDACR